MPAIATGYQQNYDVILRAARNGDLVLVDCQLKESGDPVVVLCALSRREDDTIDIVPLATMFDDNPYEILNPPDPDGGYRDSGSDCP